MEKIEFISEELVKLKLMRPKPKSYPWFEVVPWVGCAFMAYLASCLGTIPEVNACPMTDDLASYRTLGGPLLPRSWEIEPPLASVRRLVLNEILPVPVGEHGVAKLVRFKERHQKQLRQFREAIERISAELIVIRDAKERRARAASEARRLRQEAMGLAESMRGSWKQVVFRDILPLLAGGTATIVEPHNPLAVISGASSLVNAVYQFIAGQADRKQRLSQPLAYAALVHRNWTAREQPTNENK
jgi:hypothetical protein